MTGAPDGVRNVVEIILTVDGGAGIFASDVSDERSGALPLRIDALRRGRDFHALNSGRKLIGFCKLDGGELLEYGHRQTGIIVHVAVDVFFGEHGGASDCRGKAVCLIKDMTDGAASFSGPAHFGDVEENVIGGGVAGEHHAVGGEDASAHGGNANVADILPGDFFLNFLPFVHLNRPETDQDHRIREEDAKSDDDDSDPGKKRRVHTDSPVVGNLTLY